MELAGLFQGRDAMLNAIWTRMFGLGCGIGRRTYRAAPWATYFSGVGSGWVLLAIFQQFLSQLGCSAPVVAAVWCIAGLSWALAWNLIPFENSRATATSRTMFWGLMHPATLLVIVAAGPWVWPLHDSMLSDAILGSPWILFGYAAIAALMMLAIPVWCVARLALIPNSTISSPETATSPVPVGPVTVAASFVLGVATGVLLSPAYSLGNLYTTSLLAGVVILVSQTILVRQRISNPTRNAVAQSHVAPPTDSDASVFVMLQRASVALACGGLLTWMTSVIGLLLVMTLFTYAAMVAGTLAGLALGCRLGAGSQATLRGRRLWGSFTLIVSALVLTAGFSFVVYRLITLSGTVSQVWLLQGLRDLFVALLTIPLGFVWAQNSVPSLASSGLGIPKRWSASTMLVQPGFHVACASLGGLMIPVILIPNIGLSATSYLLLLWIAAITLSEVLRHAELPRATVLRGALGACGLALLCTPFMSHSIRPELASRLLFSTNVYLAERNGIPGSQLPFLDESRLNQLQTSEHGVISVWRSAISRYQVRENGIPRGVISTNGAIAPQASAEVLISLLPLTLYEQPRNVALLGLGAGVPMFTCLGSQDLGVTLVESDSQLVSIVQNLTAKSDLAALWKEKRLQHVQADPALWVNGRGQQYDVVISNPDQSALLRSAALYTQEFYRRASRRLTSDGIFCQRFTFHDFGPSPLQTLSATLRSVFSNVMAVEIGPGEIAFLATNSTRGLIRSDISDRMQAIYATDAMAGIGWDWSVMLTLGAYDAEHLEKFESMGRPRINSARNGWFCTQLPPELMRWGPKSTEIAQTLSPKSGKILNWLGEVSNREELLRRLSEVRGQQELLVNYPDQYWAYRSQVRKQVSTRPLSGIQKIKHEDGRNGLPPEDKRRLRYFQQLSKAIHSKKPEEFQRLESFTVPYDPLVSLFVHQELAEIAAKSSEIDPQLELEHRLHTLFFTSTNDRSVRNGLAALRLVLNKPEAVASDAERFDMLNTLLQSLQYRWESRSTAAPGNARELARDVEDNIVLGERSLAALTELAPQAGVSSVDCEARIRVIERKLLHPLRNYRARLEPHVARQKMKAEEAELDGGLPTEEELQFPGADKP